MRIAEIIGTVTLCRVHPSLQGYRWVLAVPYSLEGLKANKADGEDLVAVDQMGAGLGQKVAISEGAEAAMPFFPNKKPLDAYVAAVLDQVTITER
ncbi:MAG: hypothetical protein K2X38_00590 [Gemmataceae bacterium]|nr:hypothetical protein [Gemmataceae bacterium]